MANNEPKPFAGFNSGNEMINLTHLQTEITENGVERNGVIIEEMRPIEVHVRENGTMDDKPSFCFIFKPPPYIPFYVQGQISLRMLNDGLKEAGYKIEKL
jgi:hypothetical protein